MTDIRAVRVGPQGGEISTYLLDRVVEKETPRAPGAAPAHEAARLLESWSEVEKEEWIPAASIAYALRFMKRRYARRLSKRPEHVQMHEELTPVSLILANPDTHPLSGRHHATHMAIQAIHQATETANSPNPARQRTSYQVTRN